MRLLKGTPDEFRINDSSVNLNLLGIELVETEEIEEAILIGDEALTTTGQLARDVTLVIRIEEESLEDVLLGAVVVPSASAVDNSTLEDLVDDINEALNTTLVPRYEQSLFFASYVLASVEDGRLVLSGNVPLAPRRDCQRISAGSERWSGIELGRVFAEAVLRTDRDLQQWTSLTRSSSTL